MSDLYKIKENDIKRFNDFKKKRLNNDGWSEYAFFDMGIEKDSRSNTGSFYTPEWIVTLMVKNCIEKLIQKGVDINNFKILEPSVGSGNFIHILIQEIHKVTNQDYQSIINNIHVIDINSEAIDICKRKIKNLFNADLKNINIMDALDYNREYDFDLIIGNPPYGNILSKEKKHSLNDKFSNIALNFIEFFKNKLSNKGIMEFIVPHSFTRAGSGSKKWRDIIKEDYSLYQAIDVGNPFFDITLEQVILSFSREKNLYIETGSLRESLILERKNVVHNDFYNEDDNRMILYFNDEYKDIKNKAVLYPFSGKRGKDYLKSSTSKNKEDGSWIILGKNIKKGKLEHIENYDQYIIDEKNVLTEDVLAITQFGTNLKAAIIPKGCIASGGVVIVSYENISIEEAMDYLNRKSVNEYLKKYILNNAELTVHLDGKYISQIPYLPNILR